MYRTSIRWISAGLMALALALAPTMFGQGVTTSGVTGFVLDAAGKPVTGAKVIATRDDTGTHYAGVTQGNGSYSIDGLVTDTTYTVTVDTPAGPQTATGVYVRLDSKARQDFPVNPDVVKLEAVTVGSSALDAAFSSSKMSYGTSMGSREVQNIASVRQDIQDLANTDPRVALQQVSTTDSQYQMSFVGQNPRQNLILIDGVAASDNFGLNSNGVAGFASGVAFPWIQSIQTEISPVDLVYSNFTGGLQNITLKSGTNEFHGGVYTYYEGTNFRGPNPTPSAAYGPHEPYQRHQSGIYAGGPIIKNKLFFFAGYDALRIVTVPPVQNFVPDNSGGVYDQIIAKTASAYNFAAGGFNAVNHLWNQNFVAKISYNISDDHKFELTFRHTAGEAPNFYNYTSSFETSLASAWYNTYRTDQSITAKFNSDWSKFIPTLTTEIEGTYKRYNGTARINGGIFPAITIDNVPGTSKLGGTPPYALFLGTYSAYQDNNVYTWEQEEHMFAEWSHGAHTFKFGAQFDRTGYTDTFIPNYLGSYTFATYQDYLAGTPTQFTQEVPAAGYTLGDDVSHYYMLQISPLVQDTWTPTENLTIVGGVRLDDPYEPQKPLPSTVFQNAYGYTNSTTMSGNYTISPRIGFNWKLPTKLRTSIHGGAGLYLGQNPVVWYENAFNNAGQLNSGTIGTGSTTTTAAVIPGYTFTGRGSPTITNFTTPAASVPSFDINDPKFKWPANWRENISVEREIGLFGMFIGGNIDLAQVQEDSITRNINYKLSTTGPATLPDGRIHYNGNITPGGLGAFLNPATGVAYSSVTSLGTVATMSANPATGAVYELTNTNKGGAQVYSLQLSRPMKDGWAWSIGYAHTHATSVDPAPSSVASSNFADNPMVNPNDNVAYRSQYALPDKFVLQLTKQFHFFKMKNSMTSLSGQFIAQNGQPFSYVFKGDADGSGLTGESLFYVPTGPSDSKVTWSSPSEEAAFFTWLNNTPELNKYSGGIAPRNAFYAPWQHTLNLHFEQELPTHFGGGKVTLFWDCFNFANLINKKYGITENWNSSFNTRTVAGTTYNAATNQYVYTFNAATLNSAISIYPDMSRWTMTVGARLEF